MTTKIQESVLPLMGWIKDVVDIRDHIYVQPVATAELLKKAMESKLDLRTKYQNIPIYQQGTLGSCTSNAVSYAYQYTELKQQNKSYFTPSRLFLYYNTREMMATNSKNPVLINQDTGASLRDTLKTCSKSGVCSETQWGYNTTKFTVKPNQTCYTQAQTCKTIEYVSVPQTMTDLKNVIMEGYPIVFGFRVYESFDNILLDGKMPIPNLTKEKSIGGHAVCIVGYDDDIQFNTAIRGGFIVRNSWGILWGQGGYFYMPYTIALDRNLCNDFWFIKSITDPSGANDGSNACCAGGSCLLM